jgi:hypothetical protein
MFAFLVIFLTPNTVHAINTDISNQMNSFSHARSAPLMRRFVLVVKWVTPVDRISVLSSGRHLLASGDPSDLTSFSNATALAHDDGTSFSIVCLALAIIVEHASPSSSRFRLKKADLVLPDAMRLCVLFSGSFLF